MINPKAVTYAFHPTNRTIDFAGTAGFDVRNLKGILHPSGALLYFPGDPSTGLDLLRSSGTLVALTVNTASFGASDPLICLYEDGTAALPANASTADRQDAAKAVLQQILAAVIAQRAESLYTDDSGKLYVRVDQSGTISWTNLDGTPSSAPGAGARPDGDSGNIVSRSTYRATAAGAGYAVGDFLDHIIALDGDTADLLPNASFWLNITAGTKIAAPPAANITPLAPLPDGASTAALQTAAGTLLTGILAGIGAPADAAPATDAASGSAIGLLRRALGYLGPLSAAAKSGLLSVLTPSIDAAGSLSAANDAVPVSCAGRNTVVVEVPATGWTGSIVVEGSALSDFSDAVTISTRLFGSGSGPAAAAITAGGIYDANVTGLSAVRARASGAITNGPVAVLVRAAVGLKSLRVHAPILDPLQVAVGNLFALDATAQTGNTSTAATATATGATSDAATAAGASTSIIGALRAIRDRILGTLAVSGTLTSNQGTAGTAAWPMADGTDGTGTNPGAGTRGWLSGIYARLGGTLTATLAAGSNIVGAVTQSGTWAVNSTLQAGSAIIGRVGIDQTTPGITNGVVNTPASGSALSTTAPAVGTAAAQISAAGAYNHREIYNPAANTASIFIGASGVTIGTGWEIPPGGSSGDLSRLSGALFAVAASSQTVRLLTY